MKKNKLYTVTKYNRPAFMPYSGYSNSYKTGGEIINGITDKLGGIFGGDKLSKTAGSLIGAAGTAVGGVANKVLSGGLNSGAGNAVANIGGTVGGLISNVNPLLGGIVSAGTGIIGGGINALFGTKVDKEKLAAVNSDIARGRNFVSKAGTFEDIKGPEAFMTDTNVYSGGLLRDMSGKNNELAQQLFGAKEFAERSVDNNINNIWGNMVNDALYNYSAFGGPLDSYSGALGLMQNDKYIDAINNRSDAIMGKNNTLSNPQNYFGDGGGIHIKKANEGKFTAQANRAGMGVQEYASHVLANKEDYPAFTVKRANFARNAAKWHAFGGELGTNGTDWTNGLLYVDNGGTHEKNPLGGIPVGFDQNGTPNLVEEGETIWNDYVFSNRIKVPKAMFHTLGLGGAMKKNRLTFADASKKLAKESEQRPNDHISMAGLEASLSKLAAVQEAERMKKQMRESVGLENMAAYGGPVNKFDKGGALNWLKEHYGNKYNEQELNALATYLSNKVSDKTTTRLNNGREVTDNKNKSLLDQEYANALGDVTGSMLFGFGQGKLDNLVNAGVDPNLAYNIVSKDLRKGDNRNRLYSYASSLPSSGTSVETVSNADPTSSQDIQNAWDDVLMGYTAGNNNTVTPNTEVSPQVGTSSFNSPIDTYSFEEAVRNGAPQAQRGITAGNNSSTGYAGTPGVRGNGNIGVVRTRNGINPYAYDNNRWDEFEYYNPQTRQYDEGYLNFARNINQDWVDRILKGTYGDMSRYLSRNSGYQITPQEVGNLATDELYSDMHKAMQAAYKEYLAGIDPVTGEKRVTNPYGVQTPDTPAAEGEVSKVPADAINGEPRTTTEGGNEVTVKGNEKRPLLDTWMRYAPVVGGALGVFGDMLGLTNKPDYTYADRLEAAANAAGYAPQVGYKPIGDYERYTPFDRLFYANQLQANARGTDRMLANTSSPSRAAGLLANAYNTNNALGNLYRQGDEYNLAQYQQVKDFNRRTNMFNSQMGLEADIANARYRQMAKNYQMEGLGRAAALRDSIDQRVGAARSANLTNFFNSLGNIGRENFTFNQINQDPTRSYIYQTPINGGWGYIPKFMQDAYQKDVESAAQRMMEEERKKNAEAQKATQSASGAYGGKLKRNKK